MGIESILVFLIVGAVAGWLAGQIVKGHGFGLVGNIVVGIVGAFIAGLLITGGSINNAGLNARSLIASFIGAVVLLGLINLFRRGRLR